MGFKTIASAAAIAVLLAGYTAIPAAQSATSDDCLSRFTSLDSDGDKKLSSSEAGQHSKGDANSDGVVSNDEFVKACTQGIFNMPK